MPGRNAIVCGALLAALSVGLGAYHAHGLERVLEPIAVGETRTARQADLAKRMGNWEVASRYQMYHALGLVAAGLLSARGSSRLLTSAATLFVIGIALFSGLLYALALGGPKWLGAIVPLGGLSFIVGWVVLAAAAWKSARDVGLGSP